MFGDRRGLNEALDAASDKIRSTIKGGGKILYVTHNDADGITAGAVGLTMLARESGVDPSQLEAVETEGKMAIKGLEGKVDYVIADVPTREHVEELVDRIKKSDYDLVMFSDLGTGIRRALSAVDKDIIILDHHSRDERAGAKANIIEINPNLFGYDEEHDLSGSTTTYLLAKRMDKANEEMAGVAVIGAIGDWERDPKSRRMVGLNADVLKDAEAAKGPYRIETGWGFDVFGRDTVPIAKALVTYCRELPFGEALIKKYGLPEDASRARQITAMKKEIEAMGIATKADGEYRTISDLTKAEDDRLYRGLYNLVRSYDDKIDVASKLRGQTYALPNMPEGTCMSNGQEMATLYGSCRKMDELDRALNVCFGREDQYEDAIATRNDYKRLLGRTMGIVLKDDGRFQRTEKVTFLDLHDVKYSLGGTVAGMVAGETEELICSYSNFNDKYTKVSFRNGSERRVDLASVARRAAEDVGGVGGGHPSAAGAFIPYGELDRFKEKVAEYLG